MTAVDSITVAQQRLKNAEHNFSQARGEYQVGKGDILSLVLAERALADAQEQLISSKLSLQLAKALLENISGVEKLELLIAEKKDSLQFIWINARINHTDETLNSSLYMFYGKFSALHVFGQYLA